MKIFKQIFALAILAAALTACEKPAQELKQPVEVATEAAPLDQPVEDVPPANAAIAADPHGVPVVMPEPDPTVGQPADIPEAKARLAEWERTWAAEAEVSNYLDYNGFTVYTGFTADREEAMFFDRYPALSSLRCEFNASRIPACYDNANQRVEIQKVIEGVPYILNADLREHRKELKCGIELCLHAESGLPIGRIQPAMVDWVSKNF